MSDPCAASVYVFRNGNVAVFRDGEQVPEAQKPWMRLLAEHLESVGIDPAQACVHGVHSDAPDILPGGDVKFFKTEHGWNWQCL